MISMLDMNGGTSQDINDDGSGYSVIDGNITAPSLTLTGSLINGLGLIINNTQLGYLNSISSNVQTQLNTLSASLASINLSAIFGNTNVWTGLNSYNTNLPTSTLMPTISSQFATKNYVDSVSGTGLLALSNTWSGVSNTFSNAVVHNGLTTFSGNISANSATITPTILSYISTLSSNVQTQITNINTSALLSLSNNWSGTTNTFSNAVNLNGLTTFSGNISANATTITPTQLAFVSGASSNLQTQITSINTNLTTNYAPKSGSNTWTGALNQFTQQVLIGGTFTINGNISCNAINTITPFSLGCLQGATSNLQTQLNFLNLTTATSYLGTNSTVLTNATSFSSPVCKMGLCYNTSANSTQFNTPQTVQFYPTNLNPNIQTIELDANGNTSLFINTTSVGSNIHFSPYSYGSAPIKNINVATDTYYCGQGILWKNSNIPSSNCYIGYQAVGTTQENINMNGVNLNVNINGSLSLTNNLIANGTSITSTQLGYLSGATSNIQNQINSLPTSSGSNTFSGSNNFTNNNIFNSTNGIALETYAPLSISSALQTTPTNNNSMTINLPQNFTGTLYITAPLFTYFSFTANPSVAVLTQTFSAPSASMTINGTTFTNFTVSYNNTFPNTRTFNIPVQIIGPLQSCTQYISSQFYYLTISSTNTPNTTNPLVITFTSSLSQSSNTGFTPSTYGANFMNSNITTQSIVGSIVCNTPASNGFTFHKIKDYYSMSNISAPIYCGGIFNSGGLLASPYWTSIGNIVNTTQTINFPAGNGVYILLVKNDSYTNSDFFNFPESMCVSMLSISNQGTSTCNILLKQPSTTWTIVVNYWVISISNNMTTYGSSWFYNYIKLY